MFARGLALEVATARGTASANAPELVALRPAPAVAAPTPATVVARWTLRVAAFVFPLAFLPNVVSEFVLPKLLLLRLLLVVLSSLLLVRWLSQSAITWRRTPLDLPLAVFVGSAAISTAFAVNRNLAIFGSYDRWEGLLTIISYAVLFWLVVQTLSGQSDARGLVWSFLAGGYVVGAIAILQSKFGVLGGGSFVSGGGLIRPDVTLGHPVLVGVFLAMLIPVALAKVLSKRPAVSRALALSIVIVLSFGLVATLTRGAWIGATFGIIVVLALRGGAFRVWPVIIGVGILASALALSAVIIRTHPSALGGGPAAALAQRVASITDTKSVDVASRLTAWRDSLPLIASRPIFGWGPDTFGLVYPRYQSNDRRGSFLDKPHQEALGVAAAQGILGLAAYIWLLVAFARAFWHGRHLRGAVGLFGGLVAYEVSIQTNFSWIPAAVPFWILAACAIVTWAPKLEPVHMISFPRRIAVPALVASGLVLVALVVPAVVFPYLADAKYYATSAAPDLGAARATIAGARHLAPYEATYANEAGDYALNLDVNGNPSPNANWQAAREAYETAAGLGSFSPEMFRTLALVDDHLGDHAAALGAAGQALALDRYDPASNELFHELAAR